MKLNSSFDVGARWEFVVNITLQPIYSREITVIHWTGGRVEATAGLGGCGNTHPHQDSIPGQPTPYLTGYDRKEYQNMERLHTDNTSRMV
jgi:hypothetical protein